MNLLSRIKCFKYMKEKHNLINSNNLDSIITDNATNLVPPKEFITTLFHLKQIDETQITPMPDDQPRWYLSQNYKHYIYAFKPFREVVSDDIEVFRTVHKLIKAHCDSNNKQVPNIYNIKEVENRLSK